MKEDHQGGFQDWDLPDPFTLDIQVRPQDTDRLGHANNVVYVRWLEDISWAHIESEGMTWALHEQTGKAMAITRTEIDYLAAANAGDQLVLATWFTDFDNRIRSARQFQLVRTADSKTLMRAISTHACVNMQSQRPARVPAEFAEIFRRIRVEGGFKL
ncbi:acyl-CoA thioesterase [Marinobacter bryozoorum]|uniref:acyl-CoA thioesterase n=1 Tax=Marinobacter bryozoorum TaxID=256324 RepID=UPI002006996F|nr:acyl-CoA thioesterase [Marinobacter bryozoorum]MCK7544535.1 acyl-CoA thioesterase [Marinobacter bryozoorum]